MQVRWITGKQGEWWSLNSLNLGKVKRHGFHGVYVIKQRGHGSNPNPCVYVGQGDIADRLSDHRNDPDMEEYGHTGELRVTWANVPAAQRDGVERYLTDILDPQEGERHPDVPSISVNLPVW